MITQNLSPNSVKGRDINYLLQRIKELQDSENAQEVDINQLQTELENLLQNGQIENLEVGSAWIHSLISDGMNTSKAITIRGITGPGWWSLGHYGTDQPYQYRPEIDATGTLQTTQPWLNIPTGTPVQVEGTIQGSNQVNSRNGGPSFVLLSCGLPDLEFQALVFWTDKGCSAIYSQNDALPYKGIEVVQDINTNSPVLAISLNDWVWQSFPTAEIILTSWGFNFSPVGDSYQVQEDTTNTQSLQFAGNTGFAINKLDLPENAVFNDITVTGEATINRAVIGEAQIDVLNITKTSVTPISFDIGAASFNASPDYVGDINSWYQIDLKTTPAIGLPEEGTGQAHITFYRPDQVSLNLDGTHYIPNTGEAPIQSIVINTAIDNSIQTRGGSGIFVSLDESGTSYLIPTDCHIEVLLFGNAIDANITTLATPPTVIDTWEPLTKIFGKAVIDDLVLENPHFDSVMVDTATNLSGLLTISGDIFQSYQDMPNVLLNTDVVGTLDTENLIVGTDTYLQATEISGLLTSKGIVNTGGATLDSLTTTGQNTFESTSEFQNDVSISGATSLSGTLSIEGEIIDDVYIRDNAFISGSLTVSGDLTLDSIVATSGYFTTELDVSGVLKAAEIQPTYVNASSGIVEVADQTKNISGLVAANTKFVIEHTGDLSLLTDPQTTLVDSINDLFAESRSIGLVAESNVADSVLTTQVTYFGEAITSDYSKVKMLVSATSVGKINFIGRVTAFDEPTQTFTVNWTQINSAAYIYSTALDYPSTVLVVNPINPSTIHLTLAETPAGTLLNNTTYYKRISIDLSGIGTELTTTDPITWRIGRIDVESGGTGYVANDAISVATAAGTVTGTITSVDAGGVIATIAPNMITEYASDPRTMSTIFTTGSSQGAGAIISVISRYAPGSNFTDGVLELVDGANDPLIQHSALMRHLELERGNTISLTAVGIQAPTPPSPATYNLRDGIRYFASTTPGLPITFPMNVQTWNATNQQWSTATSAYTPNIFDAWYDENETAENKISYYNFNQWTALAFTVDESTLVHIGGQETITGQKTFSQQIVVPIKNTSLRDPLLVTAKTQEYATEAQVQATAMELQTRVAQGTLKEVLAPPVDGTGPLRKLNVASTADFDPSGVSNDIVGVSSEITQFIKDKAVSTLNARQIDNGDGTYTYQSILDVVNAALTKQYNTFVYRVLVDATTLDMPYVGATQVRVQGHGSNTGFNWMLLANNAVGTNNDLWYRNSRQTAWKDLTASGGGSGSTAFEDLNAVGLDLGVALRTAITAKGLSGINQLNFNITVDATTLGCPPNPGTIKAIISTNNNGTQMSGILLVGDDAFSYDGSFWNKLSWGYFNRSDEQQASAKKLQEYNIRSTTISFNDWINSIIDDKAFPFSLEFVLLVGSNNTGFPTSLNGDAVFYCKLIAGALNRYEVSMICEYSVSTGLLPGDNFWKETISNVWRKVGVEGQAVINPTKIGPWQTQVIDCTDGDFFTKFFAGIGTLSNNLYAVTSVTVNTGTTGLPFVITQADTHLCEFTCQDAVNTRVLILHAGKNGVWEWNNSIFGWTSLSDYAYHDYYNNITNLLTEITTGYANYANDVIRTKPIVCIPTAASINCPTVTETFYITFLNKLASGYVLNAFTKTGKYYVGTSSGSTINWVEVSGGGGGTNVVQGLPNFKVNGIQEAAQTTSATTPLSWTANRDCWAQLILQNTTSSISVSINNNIIQIDTGGFQYGITLIKGDVVSIRALDNSACIKYIYSWDLVPLSGNISTIPVSVTNCLSTIDADYIAAGAPSVYYKQYLTFNTLAAATNLPPGATGMGLFEVTKPGGAQGIRVFYKAINGPQYEYITTFTQGNSANVTTASWIRVNRDIWTYGIDGTTLPTSSKVLIPVGQTCTIDSNTTLNNLDIEVKGTMYMNTTTINLNNCTFTGSGQIIMIGATFNFNTTEFINTNIELRASFGSVTTGEFKATNCDINLSRESIILSASRITLRNNNITMSSSARITCGILPNQTISGNNFDVTYGNDQNGVSLILNLGNTLNNIITDNYVELKSSITGVNLVCNFVVAASGLQHSKVANNFMSVNIGANQTSNFECNFVVLTGGGCKFLVIENNSINLEGSIATKEVEWLIVGTAAIIFSSVSNNTINNFGGSISYYAFNSASSNNTLKILGNRGLTAISSSIPLPANGGYANNAGNQIFGNI